MLNRRILRIKAFKVLYSYAENPSMTLQEAESCLETSMEATRTLYIFLLGVIPAITGEAARRTEDARNKFNPTEEERNPNMKFVENSLAHLLDQDPDFQKAFGKRKLDWEQYDAFLRSLYESVCSKDWYKEYMSSPERSLREDVKLFTRMFEEEFSGNEALESILEDLSIWWNDDLEYSLTACCDTLRDIALGQRWELPPLFKSQMPSRSRSRKPDDSDRQFVTRLLRTAYSCYGKYSALVADSTSQWDVDRLFVTDIVLIVMGLAEAKAFPDMPLKVTINEYVEISKFYSTPKSRSFVNGILDRLVKKLIGEGEIVKTEIID